MSLLIVAENEGTSGSSQLRERVCVHQGCDVLAVPRPGAGGGECAPVSRRVGGATPMAEPLRPAVSHPRLRQWCVQGSPQGRQPSWDHPHVPYEQGYVGRSDDSNDPNHERRRVLCREYALVGIVHG